jgi:hypothetical protein
MTSEDSEGQSRGMERIAPKQYRESRVELWPTEASTTGIDRSSCRQAVAACLLPAYAAIRGNPSADDSSSYPPLSSTILRCYPTLSPTLLCHCPGYPLAMYFGYLPLSSIVPSETGPIHTLERGRTWNYPRIISAALAAASLPPDIFRFRLKSFSRPT